MNLYGRFLRMYRLCGGGGVAGGGPKPQTGVVFRYGPPPALHHHHHQAGHAPYLGAPPPARKKTWSFIQDSLSYDTFFTMKRLIERSHRTDEVLRWICQNPAKVSHSHLAVALQRISQLLQAPPPGPEATPTEARSAGAKAGDRKWILEHRDFLSLCDAIERNVSKLDNYSLVTSLYSAAAIGLTSDLSVVRVLESECLSRVPQFNQKDLSMVFSSVMRLHPPPPLDTPPKAEGPVEEQGPSLPPSTQQEGVALTAVTQRDAPDVGVALTVACLSGPSAQREAPDLGVALTEVTQREAPDVGVSLTKGCLSGPSAQREGPDVGIALTEVTQQEAPDVGVTLTKGCLSGPSAQREAPDVGVALKEACLSGPSTQREAPDVGITLTEVTRREVPDVGAALTEACLSGLERSLERERHPQTLFLLLAYYRGRWRELHGQSERREQDTPTGAANPELLLTNRKILRVVKHTLSCVSVVRDQEMALLDEMLAACASEASNRTLELIFNSHLFHQNRQERFIQRLAEELPVKAEALSPTTMALIAKYVARHRLRETQLLDTIATYLLKRAEQLDSKVIQRLVFPFSRMNYTPHNAPELFRRLEKVLENKALTSPLATVNIVMSLIQLHFYPSAVLYKVFSPSFISDLTNSPHSGIVRRYLSVLDAAVELEFREYSGPRLSGVQKVLMFDHALTADEANRKYSYKGLVAEALRQLVGEHSYKQDQILAPGYTTDFLVWIHSSRRILPIRSAKPCDPSAGWQLDSSGLSADFQKFSLEAEPSGEALSVAGGACLHHMTPLYSTDQDIHRVVLSVNDKWHYCHNSQVLVGSRAMRDRHLRLLGFTVLQLPYHELEKLNGIEDVKIYLHQKLTDLQL